MEYDFRTRFHLPLEVVGRSMSWGEAKRLLVILRKDPSSQFAAALEKWDYPWSREAEAMASVFDLEFAKASKTPEKYPRPYEVDDKDRRNVGDRAGRTREEVIEILRAHGHAV